MAARKSQPQIPKIDAWLEAQDRAFQAKLDQLLKTYEGEFVGMYRGRVVDHDKDDEQLAYRMYQRLGGKRFFIGEVSRTPTVYHMPSVGFE